MATSGTTTFNLDLSEIIEEAWERAGKEVMGGYSVRTARRSLNLLLLEWASKQVNLWTLEQLTIPMVAGTATYSLPAGTVDIIEYVMRTGSGTTQNDISLQRVGLGEYSNIPTKTAQGRPIEFYVDRQIAPTITFWPVPDSSMPYTFVYWRMRRIQDSGTQGNLTMDVPDRALNALISGLAYYLAMKDTSLTDRVDMLKAIYEEQFTLFTGEDRERVSVFVKPRIM